MEKGSTAHLFKNVNANNVRTEYDHGSVDSLCMLPADKLSNSKSYSTSVLTIKPSKMEPKSSKSPKKKKISLSCLFLVILSVILNRKFDYRNFITHAWLV